MTTARNAGRINVWPSTVIARAADTAESKVLGRMTVWPTAVEAKANKTVTDVGESASDRLLLVADLLKLGTDQLVLGA